MQSQSTLTQYHRPDSDGSGGDTPLQLQRAPRVAREC